MPNESGHELLTLDRPTQPGQPPSPQSWKNILTGVTTRQVAFWVLDTLRPEILSRRKPHSTRLHERSTTAWLDGLRGCAALLVCLFHLNLWTHNGINACYGADLPNGEKNITPATWPIVRILWTGGHLSVMLFFAISGYILPKRLISLLHDGRQADFITSLHSAVCRRPVRLFLPVLFSTVFIMAVWDATGLPAHWKSSNFLLDLRNWFIAAGKFLFFFRGTPFSLNQHTWSIPVEFRGSMALFAWLFALSQTSNKARLLLTLVMVWYLVFGVAEAIFATFFAGMVTAELDLIATGSIQMTLPWDGLVKALKRRPLLRGTLLHLVLLIGLYLGGEPTGDGSEKTIEAVLGSCQGWSTLSRLIPFIYEEELDEHRVFWLFWASWLLLFACKEIGWLRRSLEGAIPQYLGRHSFALYLVHGPIISLFSERLFYLAAVKYPEAHDGPPNIWDDLSRKWYDADWFPFTNSGPYGLEPNYLFCVVLSVMAFLYAAEIGTKIFDHPSVRLSKWVYMQVLKGS